MYPRLYPIKNKENLLIRLKKLLVSVLKITLQIIANSMHEVTLLNKILLCSVFVQQGITTEERMIRST